MTTKTDWARNTQTSSLWSKNWLRRARVRAWGAGKTTIIPLIRYSMIWMATKCWTSFQRIVPEARWAHLWIRVGLSSRCFPKTWVKRYKKRRKATRAAWCPTYLCSHRELRAMLSILTTSIRNNTVCSQMKITMKRTIGQVIDPCLFFDMLSVF